MKYFSDGGSLPQGKSAPSFSPRAARSHSASVGSRNSLSVFSLSHRQYAAASSQLTPTTGWFSLENIGSRQNGGSTLCVSSRNCLYSLFVTGNLAIPKLSSHTRWQGRSFSCSCSLPIKNEPSEILTMSGLAGIMTTAETKAALNRLSSRRLHGV